MTKTPTSWIDVTTSHLRLNPGKSLMNIMPAAKAEWKKIKAGLHPSKMVGPPKKHSSKHKKQHGGNGCSSNAEGVGKEGVDSANGADEPQPYVNGNELDGAGVGQVGAGGKSKKHKRNSKHKHNSKHKRHSNNNRNKTKKHKRNSKRNSKHNRSKKH